MKKILVYIVMVVAALGVGVNIQANNKKNDKIKITVQKPDMDKIKAEINDPKSRYYYPRLMANYEKNETIQTLEDYRHLYLGYLFQEDYDPYRRSAYSSKIEPMYYQDKFTRAELDTIIKYAELSLADNPFDLRQINFLIYAYRNRGKLNKANIWQFRLNHIIAAIVSTGTGLNSDNAWYVINPEHEYNIINFMQEQAKSQEFVQPYFDHVKLEKKGPNSPDGYYFNIKNLLEEYYRKNPEE